MREKKFQPSKSHACAAYAIAYLSSVPVERVEALLGTEPNGASLGDIRTAALECGLMLAPGEVGGALPPSPACIAILENGGMRHCAVWLDGEVYDPAGFAGSYRDALDYWKKTGRRVSAWIESFGSLIGTLDLE